MAAIKSKTPTSKAKKTTSKTTKKSTKKSTKSKVSNKTLLIVESPAKARTINKYLGRNYIVEASVGHIKDLTKFRLGVDIENGFQPKYFTIKGKGDIIKKLRQLSGETKQVLIATDPDREGEAIAWHIAEEVKKKNDNVKRVLFNEITKAGIKKGIEQPLDIDEKVFMAQQARRVMDRLIGYQVSPFLSRALLSKTTAALSAGRVQSVALRLICERDNLIKSFVPIEYWNIFGDFSPAGRDKDRFRARLVAIDGDNLKNPEGSGDAPTDEGKKKVKGYLDNLNYIKDELRAAELADEIRNNDFIIDNIVKKTIQRKPSAPFSTSLLQQSASRRLGFSNKKTMLVAQKLYEGRTVGKEGAVGLITYMRTDSVRVSPEAVEAARDYIGSEYGRDYVPAKPPFYKTKSAAAQDAHEAIRPTSLELTPAKVREYLSPDEAKLYKMIFDRFIASQMSPAKIDQTSVSIRGGRFTFRASGSVIAFKGFLAIYDDVKKNGKETNEKLPQGLAKDLAMILNKAEPNQSFTKPLPRFTESSLVKELDELGIGRPSTYAQIVSTLVDREYVDLSKKSFSSTELGEDVNNVLVKNFPTLFNVDFTAEMERELDTIAAGELSYSNMMSKFYDPFSKSLEHAEKSGDIPEIICEECGAPMLIKVSRRGRFLGCSKYPDCTFTKPLPKSGKDQGERKPPEIMPGVTCDNCGKEMVIRTGRYGRFLGCIDYPKCKGIKAITTSVKCPDCGQGELSEKYSPKSKKKFWGCSTYPKCKYLTNYEPINRKCSDCGHEYVEYRYRKVNDEFQKYINCPKCHGHFKIEE